MDQNSFIPQTERVFNGRRRKRKRSRIQPGFPKPCDICECKLNTETEYQIHINGKRHAKELRKKQIQDKLNEQVGTDSWEQAEDLIVIDPITSRRKCSVCSVEFTSPMIEESHMNSRRHKKMVKNNLLAASKTQRPTAKTQFGKCEICEVNYTSLTRMKEHLAGKKHKKLCGKTNVPVGKAFPTGSEEQPPVKKLKLRPMIQPITVTKPPEYELLERQAEEAYENYKSVAFNLPLAEAQALYMKYQAIYRAYEAAYREHMASWEDTK